MSTQAMASDVPEELQPISVREKVAYGLGDVASCIVYGSLGSFLLFFFTDIALIPAAMAGTIVFVSRFLEAGSNVVVGVLNDRTQTKWGKCRPWLFWLAIPWGITTVLLFTVPNFDQSGRILYAWITFNLMTTVVYSAINMPYGALASMITRDQKERAILSVYRASFGCISVFAVSTFTTTFVTMFGGGAAGWQRTFIMYAIISTALFYLCFLGTKERVHTVVKPGKKLKASEGLMALAKNKYWWIMTTINVGAASMSTLYGMNTYYARYILQDMGYTRSMMLCATFSLIIVPFLCIPFIKRFGKRNVAFYGGAWLALFGQLILIFFGESGLAAIYSGLVLRGFGIAAITGSKFGMITDSIEYGEYVSGLRTEGLINSGAAVGIKVGSAVSSAAIGWILGYYGYVGGATAQTEHALQGIRVLFYQAPLVVIIFMLVLIYLYKLDKEYPKVMEALAQRRAQKSQAGE